MEFGAKGPRPRSESLLKWVNTFDAIACQSFCDLSSGQALLQCLQNFMPNVVSTKDPWKDLFQVLEEYCDCSLDKAISTEKVLSGDQEHISRVMVLLLSMAVQSEDNEKVIAAILSLDTIAQRDIMFFIESTCSKVKSHSIVAGTFTSGMNEPNSNMEDHVPSSPQKQLLTSNIRDEEPISPSLAHDPSNEVLPFRTPRKPSKTHHPSNFYNGLDSCAGAKLLMSPAIGRCSKTNKTRIRYDLTSVRVPLQYENQECEELLRLRHSIRVLEGSLDVENKLAQEYYTEMCSKIEECEKMKNNYCQLENKLECIHHMNDIQDELAQANMNLAVAQKSLVDYKGQVQSLERYKDKVLDFESKLKDFNMTVSQLDESNLRVKKMENSLMEKVSMVKHLELQLKKVTIELETKTSHIDSLLQENREYKKELCEREDICTSLKDTIDQLEMKLESKEGAELAFIEHQREMAVDIEELQASVHNRESQISKLVAEKKDIKAHASVLEEEMGQLHKELDTKISGLISRDLVVQSMEITLRDLDGQLADLQFKTRELKQFLVLKQDELTVSNGNISSLTKQNAELQEQLATSGLSITQYKTELVSKDNLITSLTESYETKISEMAQEQSSLKLANNLIKSLALDKSDLQTTLEQVQQELISADEASAIIKDGMLNKVRELQLDVESLQSKCTAQESEIAHNEGTIRQINATVKTLKLENTTKRDELDKEHTGHELIKEEYFTLKEKVHQQKIDNDKVAETFDMILKKQKLQLDLLSEEVYKVNTIEAENLAKEAIIVSLFEDKKALKKQLLATQEELKRQADSNQTKKCLLQEGQELLSAAEKKVDIITADRSSLREKLKVLHAETDAVSSKNDHLVRDHEMTLRSTNEKLLLSEEANVTLSQQCAQFENVFKAQASANDKDRAISEHELQLNNAQQIWQTQLIEEVRRENNKLMSENNKLFKDLTAMEEQNRKCDSIHQTALAIERETSHKLNEFVLALKAELAKSRLESPHLLVDSLVTLPEDSSRSIKSICLSSTESSALNPKLGSNSNMKPKSGNNTNSADEINPANERNRARELRQRNKRALPHLQSSYPIEMQVQPKTYYNCDSYLYNMPKIRKACSVLNTLKSSTSASFEQLQPRNAPMCMSYEVEQCESKKRDLENSDFHSQENNQSSSRPLSAPPTPQTPAHSFRRKPLAMEKVSLCPSLNLRDFLDESSKKTQHVPSGMAFEVAFSPPKAKLMSIPKCLQEKRQCNVKGGSETSTSAIVAKKKIVSRTRKLKKYI